LVALSGFLVGTTLGNDATDVTFGHPLSTLSHERPSAQIPTLPSAETLPQLEVKAPSPAETTSNEEFEPGPETFYTDNESAKTPAGPTKTEKPDITVGKSE